MDFDRESIASAVVGTGGAWMLGSAAFNSRSHKWNAVQRRGMAFSGAGFLLSASAARWLQSYGRIGIACALLGSALAMIGMYTLVKEKSARREAEQSDRHRARNGEP